MEVSDLSCSSCRYWKVVAGYSHYQGYCMRKHGGIDWRYFDWGDYFTLPPFKSSADCCNEHEPIEQNR